MNVIDRPDYKTGKTSCDLCSSMGAQQGVKDFRLLYVAGNTSQVITLCKECAEKVALFLLRAWPQ